MSTACEESTIELTPVDDGKNQDLELNKEGIRQQAPASGENNEKDLTIKGKDAKYIPPFSRKGLYKSLLKQTDQMSPLRLSKMPTWIVISVMILLFAAWAISFFYEVGRQYNQCSKSNGCITCAITTSTISDGDCQSIATTNFRLNAGCVSLSIPNDYDQLMTILNAIEERITTPAVITNMPAALKANLLSHGEIAKLVQRNSINQVIDFRPEDIRGYIESRFIGFNSDYFSTTRLTSSQLPDDVAIALGMRFLSSYVAMGCVMASMSSDFTLATITDGAGVNTDYVLGSFTPASIICPIGPDITEAITASFDVSVLEEDSLNGLNLASIAIPVNYLSNPKVVNSFVQYDSAAEPLLFNTDDQTVTHCPLNAFTGTTGSLNSEFYECCTEKSNLDKLATAYAFSCLVLTFAVLVTTVLFWPWNPKSKETLQDVLKEEIAGMFE